MDVLPTLKINPCFFFLDYIKDESCISTQITTFFGTELLLRLCCWAIPDLRGDLLKFFGDYCTAKKMSSLRMKMSHFLPAIRALIQRLRNKSSTGADPVSLDMKREMSTFMNHIEAENVVKNMEILPGPKKLPFIGTAWIYILRAIDLSKQNVNLQEHFRDQYGDIVSESLPGGVGIVHLYKANDFQAVYRNDGRYPVRGIFPLVCKFNAKHNHNLHGLSTSEGQYWKNIRSAVQQKLFQPKHTDGWFSKHLKVTEELLGLIENKTDKEGIVPDMNTILERYSLEVVTTATFNSGLDADWTDIDNSEIATQYIETVKRVNQHLIDSLFSFPWYKFIDTPFFKNYAKLNFHLDQLLNDKIVSEITGNSNININSKCPYSSKDQSKSLIYQLITDDKLSKLEITTIVKDIIYSSVFTLRSFLSFVLYALSKNPEAQSTLRNEINDVLRKNNGEPLSQKIFENLPYMKAFVKETLRCYPVVPGNVRKLDKDLQLGNYTIKKGTYMKMHHTYPAMSEENFENPTEFHPERWLRSTDKSKSIPPFAVVQFGFGPRSCPGKRMALTEAYLMMIKIVSNFKIEYPDDSFKIKSALQFHPPDDLRFKFTKIGLTND